MDYFFLVMVLANAILLGLRRWVVTCIDRKEFKEKISYKDIWYNMRNTANIL